MAKKKKRATQNVTTVTPTAQTVGIYIDGKLIAKTEGAQINSFEINQN